MVDTIRASYDKAYRVKHLGMWFFALATYAYQSLGANWPTTAQEWTLFALGCIVFIGGMVQSYTGANKATN